MLSRLGIACLSPACADGWTTDSGSCTSMLTPMLKIAAIAALLKLPQACDARTGVHARNLSQVAKRQNRRIHVRQALEIVVLRQHVHHGVALHFAHGKVGAGVVLAEHGADENPCHKPAGTQIGLSHGELPAQAQRLTGLAQRPHAFFEPGRSDTLRRVVRVACDVGDVACVCQRCESEATCGEGA